MKPPEHYVIIATGKPAGNAPPRSLRAVVRWEDDGSGSLTFTLVYYNDTYIPESTERGADAEAQPRSDS